MAFTRVQGLAAGAGGPATSIGVTLGAAVSSGSVVVGCCSWGTSTLTDLISVTDDKGNTYTIANKVADATNAQSVGFFYLGNITNGPITITANFVGSFQFLQIAVDEYSGALAASDPTDGHSVAAAVQTGSAATDFLTSGNFTTTVNGDLIWGAVIDTDASATAPSAGTGFTRETTSTSQVTTATEDKVQSTAGSVAATFTASGTVPRNITFGVAIKPASGAAAQTPYNPWPQAAPLLAQ